MVGPTGLPLMRRLILMVGLLTRLWLGSSGSLLWCSRRPWWCALVVLVRERCGSVWWCACVGSLLGCPCVVVPSWCWLVCLRLLASAGRAPRVWAWWLHLLGCALGVVHCWSQGHPPTWSVRLTRWCVSGCVQPGPWCLAVLARRHGAPTPGVLHTRGDHMGYPSDCWSSVNRRVRTEQTLRA